MIEIELQIPTDISLDSMPAVVENACVQEGLITTLKGTLSQYPSCVHWHLKKGKERGTLEITWWEPEKRLWFKVAKNRSGDWIEETIQNLKNRIENSMLETQMCCYI